MSESKKTITVTLEVKEIVFDVMNKTHLTGQARRAANPEAYEATAYMQASEDDESSYQLRRSINNAFSKLKVELGEYLNEDASTANNRIKNEVDNDGQLKLTFLLPSNFNNSACDSLGGGMHEYIVDYAIFDWFTITNKADAADYLKLADTALAQARQALYKRERPERPTYDD